MQDHACSVIERIQYCWGHVRQRQNPFLDPWVAEEGIERFILSYEASYKDHTVIMTFPKRGHKASYGIQVILVWCPLSHREHKRSLWGDEVRQDTEGYVFVQRIDPCRVKPIMGDAELGRVPRSILDDGALGSV